MARVINADKMIEDTDAMRVISDAIMIDGIIKYINENATADVEEVRHEQWIKDTTEKRGDGEIYDYCCSLCKSPATEGSYGNRDVLTPYCSQCGAKMDGGKNDK